MCCFSGQQQCRGAEKDGPGLTKSDLLHFVLKFNGSFNTRYCAVSGIQHVAGEIGHFLVQKTLRAAHLKIAELQSWRVRLLCRTERKPSLRKGRRRSGTAEKQQIESSQRSEERRVGKEGRSRW